LHYGTPWQASGTSICGENRRGRAAAPGCRLAATRAV